jgi:formylglycine-generating enzyme required for sulfatase activity
MFRLLPLLLAALLPVVDALFASPQERKPRKVAFLVGVGTYDHAFRDLKQAPEKDVTELGKELADGGFEVVTLLGGKPAKSKDRATKANIEGRFKELLEGGEKLKNGDTLVVVLCGHGFQDNDPYFCPVDALPDKFGTMVSLNGLIESVQPFGATALFLVDACRTDPQRGARGGIRGTESRLRGKTAVLYSCEAGEEAYQDDKSGHGVFTFAVLRAMRGGDGRNWDRLVTGVKEAFQTDEVRAMLPPGKSQTPVQGSGQLGFAELLVKAGPKEGDEREFEVADGVTMRFCWVPPGKATLGSPKTEKDRDEDEDEHEYESKGFWLGKYEVTQGEWVKVTGKANPSAFAATGSDADDRRRVDGMDTTRFPVEQVSWDDVTRDFLPAVNRRPGAKAAFGKAGKFCLPHEDEWEYAARGGKGNRQAFYWGDELDGSQANCDGNSAYNAPNAKNYLDRTCAVDDATLKYPRHPWGLMHMHGNVWEWCENKYNQSGDHRVLRGGSWRGYAWQCRAASHSRVAPDYRYGSVGFRLCFRLD